MLRRLLPLAIFLLLAALLAAGIRMNAGRDMSALPSPLIGKTAPTFALPTLQDPARIIRNADLHGAPYLLNVWGSWCVNCREEHPVITVLAKRGVVKIVGYDYREIDPEDGPRWIAQFGNPYALIVVDADGRTALDWGIYGAPETYLVDAEGIVRWKHVGPLTDAIVNAQLLPRLAEESRK
jgi:cytochrome c biogenesis protein CcmG/thiol:disulfide interchange protein DsbE